MPLREGEQGGHRPGQGWRREEHQEGGGQHQEVSDQVRVTN